MLKKDYNKEFFGIIFIENKKTFYNYFFKVIIY